MSEILINGKIFELFVESTGLKIFNNDGYTYLIAKMDQNSFDTV